MTTTEHRRFGLLIAGLAAIAILGALVASDAQAALRHFDGTVLSKSRETHTFRIKTQRGNRVRFHVNGKTEFERIPGGFAGLHRGLHVQVDARRAHPGWLAKRVEKHRRSGGADDGPHHQ
jgi:hypothetical protein